MPRFFTVLLVVLGSLSVAHAESSPQWIQIQSEHFTVITDSYEKQGRHVAGQFERMRSLFHSLFPATNDAGSRIVVFAFKDHKGLQALEPTAYLAKGSLQLGGLFLSTPDKSYILVRLDNEGDEHPFSTVYHEYTHFMLRKDPWLPLWLNEGLAEFYQNTEIEGKDVRVGVRDTDNIFYLRDHPLLPLATLLSVDHNSPYYHDEQKGSVFYAESWALTHFIQMNDFINKTTRLQDYAKYQQHQDPVTAAQHAFGDLGQLQKALTEYIGQMSFKAFLVKSSFTVDEASFKAAPISQASVDAIRADVLVGTDRTDDAKVLLDKVLAEDPKNALANETEGFLCMRRQDMEGARKWFGQAVKLGSQSAMANYYFAVFSMEAGEKGSDDAIESSLLASIKLEPSFAPSYDALAHFYAIHDEKLDDAHTLFVHAIELEPQQLNYRLNASSLEMQRKQYPNAVRILEAALELSNKPDQVAMIQSRISQVKNYQAQLERSQSDSAASVPTVTTIGAATADGKTFTVTAEPPATEEKVYPVAAASAKHHIVNGTVKDVKCTYPAVLTLKLDQGVKSVPLFTANYYKVTYGAANFTPPENLNPCKVMEGMKARIEYADVTDPEVAGQIVSIILSK